MTTSVLNQIDLIRSPTGSVAAEVQRHLDCLTKPPGSLGALETVALRLAGIYGDPPPCLDRRIVFVLAADHGVARQGVSAYPAEVTAQMCRNFASGGAAINVIARSVGADVVIADFGVNGDLSDITGMEHHKVREGTRDLSCEAAMTIPEVETALSAGSQIVDNRGAEANLIGIGEMGIGNTTSATALISAFTGAEVKRVVGPGTGISSERITHKRRVIERALKRIDHETDPITIMAEVGGLEIAGLAGVILAAARRGRAIVLDGFITAAAALFAVRLCPTVGEYLFASHLSAEPGHAIALESLGLSPILKLDLRLGEGSGAALSMPIIEAGGAILREMATFESAGISGSAQ